MFEFSVNGWVFVYLLLYGTPGYSAVRIWSGAGVVFNLTDHALQSNFRLSFSALLFLPFPDVPSYPYCGRLQTLGYPSRPHPAMPYTDHLIFDRAGCAPWKKAVDSQSLIFTWIFKDDDLAGKSPALSDLYTPIRS